MAGVGGGGVGGVEGGVSSPIETLSIFNTLATSSIVGGTSDIAPLASYKGNNNMSILTDPPLNSVIIIRFTDIPS